MKKEAKKELKNIHIPRWNELPNVDLYLDQVVTFINSSLEAFLPTNTNTDKKENQILTKTMINNYVKNNLIDAPEKKKYAKIQCAKLFVICILKQVYSMNEIAKLIDIALKSSSVEHSYNSFCTHFEQALESAYQKQEFMKDKSDNENLYLLKSVLLSCCYKIYVQNMI